MNKKLILIAVVMIAATFTFAQNNVEVVVKNIKGTTGNLRVVLFNSKDTFLKTPYKAEIIKISGETMTVVFKNVPAGTYGASAVHDENANGKLDKGAMGIPEESYGFSNDASSSFGPPQFEDAAFTFPATKSVSITLQ